MLKTPLAAALLLGLASAAQADTHQISMLDMGETGHMVFEPAYLHVQPGDTVVFVPTDPGHNVASLEGLIPENADLIESAIMGEPMPVTFTEEGIYALECTPHFGMGMVAVIQVGDSKDNLETVADGIRKMRGLPKQRFTALLEQVE
ncbi:pseudoazurin [Rubellimicrobium roseum]|uniref:Pseudoazurin n=1 Tax=Rubellimicrobium roseum TaxID=687525 RepID=A0A5C4NDX6_9RHOB|nr:pseudoazurin [Rubellimicrobium roseum]TNC71538.1 pseudoazurin [Rubellimicrobium roseum]